MHSVLICLVSIVLLPFVISTTHTTCFNYFLQKDGCVFSSASSKTRCPAPAKKHPAPVQAFTLKPNSGVSRRSQTHERRYDTPQPSFPIGSGTGICGTYDSTKEIGVCLWSGAEQNNPTVETAGWLNGLKTSNCGKRIYIQRTGRPDTVQYARVLDGCYFQATSPDVGCFEIGLSIALFNRFNPTQQENHDQLLYNGLEWDFDNLKGQSPQQGPV